MRAYLRRVKISLNQLVSTLFGGAPDETISARAGRAGCPFPFSEEHCERAIENERRGATQAAPYRPDSFVTRRGALQVVALWPLFLFQESADSVVPKSITLSLDAPIHVIRGSKLLVIEPDALWNALESATKIQIH